MEAPPPFVNGGWLYDYAYEIRPDTPIVAGVVPEPSAGALLAQGADPLWLDRRGRGLR